MSCKACHHVKLPDNIGEVDHSHQRRSRRCVKDAAHLYKAAGGVSRFLILKDSTACVYRMEARYLLVKRRDHRKETCRW